MTKYAGHPQLSFSGYMMDYYHILALLKHLPGKEVAEEIRAKKRILMRGAQKHANEAILRFCEDVERQLSQFETL